MLICFFALASPLQIIYQLEKLVFGRLDASDRGVGYAEHFHRVIVNPLLDIMIGRSVNFHLAIHSFELVRRIIIGKVRYRYFDRYQLIVIVLLIIQFALEPCIGLVFKPGSESPVSKEIEQQQSQ